MKEDELIDIREVQRMTGLKRWSLFSRVYQYHEFPLPVIAKRGRKQFWSRSEVLGWMAILDNYHRNGQTIAQLGENWRRFRAKCSIEPETNSLH